MSSTNAPLAIIGIGCRMPGGITNPDEFWEMLREGRDAICDVPADRWDWRSFFDTDPEAPGKMYVRKGGFLTQDVTAFDAEFFGISPREASSMDPQQRLLLETCWEAIDDAGLRTDRLAGSSTGVYVGAFTLDNMLTQMGSQNCYNIGPHTAVSSTMTLLSNRLSYFLDLRGPSLSVDTACSSSLVAFHLACQGIRNGDCETALVGGVNVIFRPEYMIAMCKGQFLSPDGRSQSFDQRANGYGRGEGAGVVVLKTLERALQDGDRIHAIVRGTGCNQDGRTNGITVPNGDAQRALILSVLHESGLTADKISYVEAHGTGTPIGDPVEARALGEALGQDRDADDRLMIGSVKANIGHLEAASGMAALIKLCMCFKYRAIPPLANLDHPNRAIAFDDLGLRLPTRIEALPGAESPVFLAVNSFGYGGTNAHAILESPPPAAMTATMDAPAMSLLPISARSETALREMVARHRQVLIDRGDAASDICARAGLRRSHHNYRAAFSGGDAAALVAQIDEWLAASSGDHRTKLADAQGVRPVFVFSGMGPQWWGMGQQLLEREPVFAAFAARADEIFYEIAGWSILDEMRRDKETSRISRTIHAQPANFVVQAGLFELLKSWGVHPAAVIGHSVGEMSSAYAAGVLSLEDAMRVSFHRSQLQSRAAGTGGMLAVGLGEHEARALIAPYADHVTIAAVNAPKAVTLAGDIEALADIGSRLDVRSVFNRVLKVEVAYHSHFMEPLKQPLIDALDGIAPRLPQVKLYSTVTGASVDEVTYDGAYWARNIREPVYFMQALESALADGLRVFLEVGPHPTLVSSIREGFAQHKIDGAIISTLVRETDERGALFRSLGGLYGAGCDIDWLAVNGVPHRTISLPSYAWQRERHWGETEAALNARLGGPETGFAGAKLDAHEPVWERTLNSNHLPYVDDHVVQGSVLLPGAAFVDAALGLKMEIDKVGLPIGVEAVVFRKPLVLDRHDDTALRTVLEATSGKLVFYGKSKLHPSSWTRHAEARVSMRRLSAATPIDLDSIQKRLGATRDVEALYTRFAEIGLQYGPRFRRIAEIRADGDETLVRLVPSSLDVHDGISHVLHPLVLDGAFQSLLAGVEGDAKTGFIPASIDQIAVYEAIPDEVWCYGRITERSDQGVCGSLCLTDRNGRVLAAVTSVRCAAVALANKSTESVVERWLVKPVWNEAVFESRARRTGTWLLLAENGFPKDSFAAQLALGMRAAGCERLLAIGVRLDDGKPAGPPGASIGLDEVRTADDWKRLLQEYRPTTLSGIAYVTSGAGAAGPGVSTVRANHLLALFKHLPADESQLRAYLITEQAQAVEDGERVAGFLQASAIGFFRVAHNEYPGLKCSMIDHDGDVRAADSIVAELLSDDDADDVAWRGDSRYTQRLEPRTLLQLEADCVAECSAPGDATSRFLLAHTESGLAATGDPSRDVAYWKRDAERPLAADEIEIQVRYMRVSNEGNRRVAGGRGLAQSRWREFSGSITRVGEGVSRWQAGASIAAAAPCVLASHIVVREADLRAITIDGEPSGTSASLSITAVSVNAGLCQLARATHGERLLVVHGRQEDVARMFAFTGRRLGLHVVTAQVGESGAGGRQDESLLDLRDDSFGERALAVNHGHPFDIVVFCAGVDPRIHNRIPLAAGGRVVLHGAAIEALDPSRFFDPLAMYSMHRVDAVALASGNSRLYQAASADLAGADAEGQAGGFDPVCTADQLIAHLRDDSIGESSRIVDLRVLHRMAPMGIGAIAIHRSAAYVVTGGFGGFGLATADYLIANGARHIVLMGRSGATTDRTKQQIETWRTNGIVVEEARVDVADHPAVDKLLTEFNAKTPIKGVFHAAGLLDDVPIAEMTSDQLSRVMRPKLDGAWNLHDWSVRREIALDHFVLFSSASAVIGNARQANYVAANAVLDALAAHRRASGFAATTIHWGALAEVGMAATSEELRRHFELMGIKPFGVAEAMFGLGVALRFRPVQIGIMDVDWVQWGKFEPTGGRSLRFAHLTGRRDGTANDSVAGMLRKLPSDERFAVAEWMLAEQVARTLRLPPERIDVKRPLSDMGIDSLMAVELQIGISGAFGVEVSALELLRGFSVSQLAGPLLKRMGIADGEDGPGSTETTDAADDVDGLSEAELDEIIANAA